MARVLVTRASGRGDVLAERLRAGGAEVVEVNLLGFAATGAALPAVQPGDWLLLTSATVIPFIVEQSEHFVAQCEKIAAVGPATAAALRGLSRVPDVVPEVALGARMVAAMGDLRGRRVIYPRAAEVPPELEQALRAAGATVVTVPIYRTACPPGAAEALRAAMPVAVVTLASGSAARHLAGAGVDLGAAEVAVIGPSTAAVARSLGLRVDAIADPHTAEGLADAALALIRRRGSSGPS